jgi:hypothetical protein
MPTIDPEALITNSSSLDGPLVPRTYQLTSPSSVFVISDSDSTPWGT